MSPVCVQNDALAHTPELHTFEQQSAPVPHGLPDVLQVVLSGTHLPPPDPSGPHLPPQQSESVAQARLSATHCLLEQVPAEQENVQHSFPFAQAAPGALHAVNGVAHFFEVASQLAVQQSRLFAQSCPGSLQVAASAREPSVTASKNASRAASVPVLESELGEPSDVEEPSPPWASSPESGKRSSVTLPHPVKTTFAPTSPKANVIATTGSLRMYPPRLLPFTIGGRSRKDYCR